MEALRDRTVRIDVPYLLRWSDEIRILEHDYSPERVRQHVAPHTLETAALVAILTRLVDSKNQDLTLVQKAKLYDGQSMSGFNEDTVQELMESDRKEGMSTALSARYVQNQISNALVANYKYVNPFMVLNEIEKGLERNALIGRDAEIMGKIKNCITLAREELNEVLKDEVRNALMMNEDAMNELFKNYLDHVYAYISDDTVYDPYLDKRVDPDERLMRSIEQKIDIPEPNVDDFRRMISAHVGKIRHDQGEEAVTWDCHPKLAEALRSKMFEDAQPTFKLSTLSKAGNKIDPESQEKIDVVKSRLIREFGYDEDSAADVLRYVGSLFAQGDLVDN